ncbi:hypothetical protein Tco_1248980 [Tanacetum coccineum]
MHVFVGNFIHVIEFMIVEDISSIIDLRLSQVVLGKPFVEISNMTHDPSEGVVIFDKKKLGSAYAVVLDDFLEVHFNQLSHVSSLLLSKPREY